MRSLLRALYHRLLLIRTGGRGILCNLPGGESVRLLPDYRFASWSTEEYEAFRAAIKPGDVAFDIGANVGAYSLLLGQWVGTDGKVFAFEPAPETAAALGRHIALNGLQQRVIPQRLAVSDRVATVEFMADNFQGTNRIRLDGEPSTSPAHVNRVESVSVDEFCVRYGVIPDFIKIDIEGFELAALRGARETIKACADRLALFVEMHPTMWRQMGITRQDMLAELSAQNLRAEPLVSERDPWETEGVCMRLVPNSL